MFTVISYDITQDTRRTKVLKFLKGYGTHVQYSVFECVLSASERTAVVAGLASLIDPTTDSVRCYLLDQAAVGRISILGIGQISGDPSHYIV